MFPFAVTSSASTSSPLVSPSPTSEPSKYIDQVPLVLLPSVVGVNASTSSSLAPVTPTTAGFPVVESSTRPSGSRLTESIFSAVVSKPTSLPSKYILKAPAVTLPSEVASKRTTSWGATEIPFNVSAVVNDRSSESASRKEKPKRSDPPTPTSEPSKNRLQLEPSKRRISSSAEATPPIVWLPVNDRYRGLYE